MLGGLYHYTKLALNEWSSSNNMVSVCNLSYDPLNVKTSWRPQKCNSGYKEYHLKLHSICILHASLYDLQLHKMFHLKKYDGRGLGTLTY